MRSRLPLAALAFLPVVTLASSAGSEGSGDSTGAAPASSEDSELLESPTAHLPAGWSLAVDERTGGRFAGASVEPFGDTKKLVIRIKNLTPGDADTIDAYVREVAPAVADRVEVSSAAFGFNELMDMQTRLEDETIPGLKAGGIRFSFELDIRNNRINVTTSRSTSQIRDGAGRARVPTAAYSHRVVDVQPTVRAAHTEPYPPYRGGMAVYSSDFGDDCMGAAVYSNPVYGYFMAMAGHCRGQVWNCDYTNNPPTGGNPDCNVPAGSALIGNVAADYWAAGGQNGTIDADVQFISITPDKVTDDIWGIGSVIYDVTGELALGDMAVDDSVCYHIRHRNGFERICDPIAATNRTITYSAGSNTRTVRHMWCTDPATGTDEDIDGGDSGGAVYRVTVNGSQVSAAGNTSTTDGALPDGLEVGGCYTTSVWMRTVGNVNLHMAAG